MGISGWPRVSQTFKRSSAVISEKMPQPCSFSHLWGLHGLSTRPPLTACSEPSAILYWRTEADIQEEAITKNSACDKSSWWRFPALSLLSSSSLTYSHLWASRIWALFQGELLLFPSAPEGKREQGSAQTVPEAIKDLMRLICPEEFWSNSVQSCTLKNEAEDIWQNKTKQQAIENSLRSESVLLPELKLLGLTVTEQHHLTDCITILTGFCLQLLLNSQKYPSHRSLVLPQFILSDWTISLACEALYFFFNHSWD